MRCAYVFLGLMMILGLAGCGGGADAYSPNRAFVEGVIAKAGSLAEAELERLRAAELLYKDVVRFDELEGHPVLGSGVYYKGYRDYTDYVIKDIQRNPSYMMPIAYEIGFNYRFMTTERRHTDDKQSAGKAQGDTQYQSLKESQLVHVYLCDHQGEYVGDPYWLPTRETVFGLHQPQPLMPPAVPNAPAEAAPAEAPSPPSGVPLESRKLTPAEARELLKNRNPGQ